LELVFWFTQKFCGGVHSSNELFPEILEDGASSTFQKQQSPEILESVLAAETTTSSFINKEA
jgi:hypothetical protein